jgi:hypothetical protein
MNAIGEIEIGVEKTITLQRDGKPVEKTITVQRDGKPVEKTITGQRDGKPVDLKIPPARAIEMRGGQCVCNTRRARVTSIRGRTCRLQIEANSPVPPGTKAFSPVLQHWECTAHEEVPPGTTDGASVLQIPIYPRPIS